MNKKHGYVSAVKIGLAQKRCFTLRVKGKCELSYAYPFYTFGLKTDV